MLGIVHYFISLKDHSYWNGVCIVYRKFKKNIYIVPGSPVSLVVKCDDSVWLVDPGMGRDRSSIVKEALFRLGINSYKILLSHCHYDHIEALSGFIGKKVYVSILEAGILMDPLIRETVTYGHNPLPRLLGLNRLFFKDLGINVIKYPLPEKIDCLELVDLRGHSPGLLGLKLGDDAVFLADSLFGDRLLMRVGIPYHLDLYTALYRLESTVKAFADEGYRAILSHGPVVEGKKFRRLVDLNIERIKKVIEFTEELLSKSYYTLEQLTINILKHLGAEPTPSNIYLGLVPVNSILNKLYQDPGLEYIIKDSGVKWRIKRT